MFSPPVLIALLRERAVGSGMWEPVVYRRGEELLQQGVRCDGVMVLTGGLAKLTYLTSSGDEWIKSFIVDEGIFGAFDGEVSRFGAMAVEPSTVVRLPMEWIRSATDADRQVGVAAASFNRWLAERKRAREEALLCDTAEDRYRQMLRSEPGLLGRLPQGDIARYLRVTPVAFSRIKRRVKANRL